MNSHNGQRKYEMLHADLMVACAANEQRRVHRRCDCPRIVRKEIPFSLSLPSDGVLTLRWNPSVSSHKVVDWEAGMRAFGQAQPGGFYYEWSIPEHERLSVGDRFQMVMEREFGSAVVMSGIVASMPFIVPDMDDGGKPTYRVRLLPECMIHPSYAEYNV